MKQEYATCLRKLVPGQNQLYLGQASGPMNHSALHQEERPESLTTALRTRHRHSEDGPSHPPPQAFHISPLKPALIFKWQDSYMSDYRRVLKRGALTIFAAAILGYLAHCEGHSGHDGSCSIRKQTERILQYCGQRSFYKQFAFTYGWETFL